MALQFVNGQMVLHIQVSGNHAKKMVREHYNFLMDQFTKDNSKMISQMDKARKYFPMEVYIQVNSSSVCFTGMENSNKRVINQNMKVTGDKIK